MDDAHLVALTQRVLLAAFLVGGLFGALCQRTGFCTLGAVADVYAMRDWHRARTWLAGVAVAILGFHALAYGGLIDPNASIYTRPKLFWLSAIVGGGLFGVGMALSSGCVSRNLVRAGAGNLKSLVVLLVVAVSAGATLRGITSVPRAGLLERVAVELPGGQAMGSIVASHGGSGSTALWLGLVCALALLALALVPRGEGRASVAWTGFGLGAAVTAMWWVSGHLGYVAEDPRTLEAAYLGTHTRSMEALTTVAPLAHGLDWLLMFSDANNRLTLGVCSVAGMVLGASLMALATRRFRWEGFRDAEDLGVHLTGAVCMGVGGVTAMGCTIGQGLSGVSTLSLGSFLAVAAMLAGAWAGLRLQTWRLDRA